MMTERFDLFMRDNCWYWKYAGEVHGPHLSRGEAQDAAIEHLLAKARSEHAKRLAVLYHVLDRELGSRAIPEAIDSI